MFFSALTKKIRALKNVFQRPNPTDFFLNFKFRALKKIRALKLSFQRPNKSVKIGDLV